jgi:hypothetical protein
VRDRDGEPGRGSGAQVADARRMSRDRAGMHGWGTWTVISAFSCP